MNGNRWFMAAYACLLAALVPIVIGNSLVSSGATVPLLDIAVPFLLILACAGICIWRWRKST